MASFILVPGAMHGAWTWERIVPQLERGGHSALAVDLPGMRGNDSTAPEDVTLALWGEYVADLVRRATPPVVLVGHSRGGIVIGEAAERVPELLAGLIYLVALITPPGTTGLAASGTVRDPQAPAMPIGEPPAAEIAGSMFYQRCTPEDVAWAVANLSPEPMRPLETAASVTWERWGSVPRAYIRCSDDRVIAPERQDALLARTPCDPVMTLDSDHSPFLCAPEALSDALLAIGEQFARASHSAGGSGKPRTQA